METDGKRQRVLSQKALQTEIEKKRKELDGATETLRIAVENGIEKQEENKLQVLQKSTEKYKEILLQLGELYQQDRLGEYKEEAKLLREYSRLEGAQKVIAQTKDNGDDRASQRTQRPHSTASRSSRRSLATSTARRQALADAAATTKQAEFDKPMAQKEQARRVQEAEERRKKEQEQAKHELEMALLAAERAQAIANARLEAIDKCIQEELEQDLGEEDLDNDGPKIPEPCLDPRLDPEERVERWLSLNRYQPTVAEGTYHQKKETYEKRHPLTSSTPKPENTIGLLETFTATNQRLVSGLSKQSLPKCHPDVFGGEVTLFHPWKKAFKAMLCDAEVTPAQEMNYLRNFTKGEVQTVVDNFRRRHHSDLSVVLRDLWEELERRFGNTAAITNALLERLTQKAKFAEKDLQGLQTFADLCGDVDSQIEYLPGLSCLNYPNVMRPVVERLPNFTRSQWEKEIVAYATENKDAYPNFHVFASMVQRQARQKNHPNVQASGVQSHALTERPARRVPRDEPARRVLKTSKTKGEEKHCKFHDRTGHSIFECKAFEEKSLNERSEWVLKERLCFRCLEPGHLSKECKAIVSCEKCESSRHPTILHKDKEEEIKPNCTSVCQRGGTSCSKILLVDVYSQHRPKELHRVYAIMDDQSNASLISPELANKLKSYGSPERYLLSTCNGEKIVNYGRRVADVMITASGKTLKLPTLVECTHIPRDKTEIPTPEVAKRFDHLQSIVREIPPLDGQAEVHLLIGRDAPELLKVRAFKNGPKGAPWAQKLDLGWTISGQVCLNRIGGPFHVSTKRTTTWHPSTGDLTEGNFEVEALPCPNHFQVKESFSDHARKKIEDDVYHTTSSDNDVNLSIEDRKFLKIMEENIHKNMEGNWVMPLPFRSENVNTPNNRKQAESRLAGLLKVLKRKPQMEKDYLEFMAKILEKKHALPVPDPQPKCRDDNGKVWYLPHFGVYHPKKPTQIRVVFDSSAEFNGVSLNKELLTGPDLMNNLFGVLLRFRRYSVAAMCDVEQMFHSFKVKPEHQSFLRFLWYRNNDPTDGIIEYQMTVHLFCNGPSPAIATYGLRKTALDGEEEHGEKIKEFICRNFYVDDGLISCNTKEETINLVRNARAELAAANIRLHKVVSNSVEVMEALPAQDRGKDVRDLDLRKDLLPSQRTLGVQWNLQEDKFTFKVSIPDKPFTRRGILSVINSIYDPMGMAVPVTLKGKLFLQRVVNIGKTANSDRLGWDDPLPKDQTQEWQRWRDALSNLESFSLPRCIHPEDFGLISRAEVHSFCDASEEAIGLVVYLLLRNDRNEVHTSFLFGQSKVAPIKPTSIPRLELCGAVLAAQAVTRILTEIDMQIDEVIFYTDSKVVLGYIHNEARRFYTYVANRVQIIRTISHPHQWRFVDTENNPADLATRGVEADKLEATIWFRGPAFLTCRDAATPSSGNVTLLENDPEVRKITTKSTNIENFGVSRITRFSTWTSLQRSVAMLIAKAREINGDRRKDPDFDPLSTTNSYLRPTVTEFEKATAILTKIVQSETSDEIAQLKGLQEQVDSQRDTSRRKRSTLKRSPLYGLDPFVDENGILRVGGRLRRSPMDFKEKHPSVLPKNHHLSELLIRHYHQAVHHQGRQITHGAVRQAGYWIISGHGAVTKVLSTCITGKKARGKPMTQLMADLPKERTEPSPPFTSIGIDVFGPWYITTRRLRGGAANSKRWSLLFTCLSSRAIHIELLETMDASSFICALRRFFAIRGPASGIRCDRGTNFIGGKSELEQSLSEADQRKIERYATEHGYEWAFNPPHASHFGGVWERQIRTIRSVLNSMLTQIGSSQLTHELLSTLMAEVTSIVNSRPIATVPSEADDARPLSPSMLLTAKERPLNPPPGDFVPEDLYARRRWRRVQYLADQFWTRWRREYLQNLQKRPKWQDPRPNLTEGDVVLIKDEESHRNHWPLGKVIKAFESEDGRVRKAEVRKADGKVLLRPVSQLVFLVSSTHD